MVKWQSDLVKTMGSMVHVCDKRYHIYNRFRNFWAEIKKLWNYTLKLVAAISMQYFPLIVCYRLRFLQQFQNKWASTDQADDADGPLGEQV